jgi:hypothetical protein
VNLELYQVCPTDLPALHPLNLGPQPSGDADMLTTNPDAPAHVTSSLFQAEAALNDALHKQSQLLSSMLAAREHYGELQLGQEAVMRLLKSQESLVAAGGDLARVHQILLKIGREKGAVIHDCPQNEPMRRAAQSHSGEVSTASSDPDALRRKVSTFG